MNGWLPDELPEKIQPKAGMAERIVSGVKSRNLRRKRLIKEAWGGLGGLAAVAIVAVLVIPAGHLNDNRLPRPAGTGLAMPKTPAPDLTLSRVDHSVELKWQGDKSGEYVVYRCTSPLFDQCSLADKVKGTKWIDDSGGPGIIYYRVEPITGGGRKDG